MFVTFGWWMQLFAFDAVTSLIYGKAHGLVEQQKMWMRLLPDWVECSYTSAVSLKMVGKYDVHADYGLGRTLAHLEPTIEQKPGPALPRLIDDHHFNLSYRHICEVRNRKTSLHRPQYSVSN